MNRATTSFPVPESPNKRTVASVGATCVALVRTSFQAGDSPTMCPRPSDVRFSCWTSDRARGEAPDVSALRHFVSITSIAYASHDPRLVIINASP